MSTRNTSIETPEDGAATSAEWQPPRIDMSYLIKGLFVVIVILPLSYMISLVITELRVLPKNAVATRYEKAGEVVVKEVSKSLGVTVALLMPDGRELGSVNEIKVDRFVVLPSIVDNGNTIEIATIDLPIVPLPSTLLKAGDKAILWKLVTTYDVPDIRWLDETEGFYVGPAGMDISAVVQKE